MTPKQIYDERKRLRIENGLRAERKTQQRLDESDYAEKMFESIVDSLARIADAADLWASQQGEKADG